MKKSDWRIVLTKQAIKDKSIADEAGFRKRLIMLLSILKEDPFSQYPPFEKLMGKLSGAYSRRINQKHRLVYMVYEKEHTVKVISLWNHY
jgi:Txe/YoeB family toxin of toxin-antitoxin system